MKVLALVSLEYGQTPCIDAASLRTLDAAMHFARETGLASVAAAIGDADCSEALSMSGADKNVLLSDPSFAGSDTGALARIFGALMGDGEWIVFCSDGILSGYLSGMLGIPHLNGLVELKAGPVGVFLNDGYSFEEVVEGPCCVHVGDSHGWPSRKISTTEPETIDRVALGLGYFSVGTEGSLTVSEPIFDRMPEAERGRAALLDFIGAGQ